jgi:hypothetical protein
LLIGSIEGPEKRVSSRQVDAGIEFGTVDAGVEAEELREQDHTVEVDTVLVGEEVRHHRRTGSAAALAEQVLGRIPAAALRHELGAELGKCVTVAVDAVDRLLALLHLCLALDLVRIVGEQGGLPISGRTATIEDIFRSR